MKKLLTVAGSDSSGGAGIQADLKTFAALGAYGMSCICTLTAQNTTGVSMVVNTPVEMVTAQLEAVYSDIPPDGVKTGMLSTPSFRQWRNFSADTKDRQLSLTLLWLPPQAPSFWKKKPLKHIKIF